MVNAFNSPPRATNENKDFSKQVDKYTKKLKKHIKNLPKEKLLKIRKKKKLTNRNHYAQLENMTSQIKNLHNKLKPKKRHLDRLHLAQKRMREQHIQLSNRNWSELLNSGTLPREEIKKARVLQTKVKKQNGNINMRIKIKGLGSEKNFAYQKKFLNMTKKLNEQLHSRLSRSDIQNVVLSRNTSDPINLKPFKNGEIILSTGKPGQYFSLNSFEKLLKRQKTKYLHNNNTGVRKVEEIKSLAKNNRSKNVIVYKKNPLNRQEIRAKNVKFVRVVLNKK